MPDIIGSLGDDTLNGANGDDIIYGESGTGTINACGGKNTIYAGAGADTVNGSDGFDTVRGGQNRYQTAGANLLIQADDNGDGIADMEIVLRGLAGPTLACGSFLL